MDGSALVTVLFTDIVGSTEIAAELGDERWQELLTRHHRLVRAALRRFNGREIDTAGDGFFAAFDRPAQAVRCACTIVQTVRELGIEVRAGVHIGEAEITGRTLRGMAVHTGARISSLAGPGEVLVSGTLRDLITGATLSFEERGRHSLKGIPGEHLVLTVTAVDGTPLPPRLAPEEAAARRKRVVPMPKGPRPPVWLGVALAVLVVVASFLIFADFGREPQGIMSATRNVAVLVDPGDGSVNGEVRIPPTRLSRFEASQVTIGLGSVWIVNGRCVCRIDLETQELDTIVFPFPTQMTLGHRAAWVLSLDGGVYPIEAAAAQASDPITLPAAQIFTASVASTQDAVWVAFAGRLARIDPVEETIGEPIDIPHATDDIIGTGRGFWVVDRLARLLYRYDAEARRVALVSLQDTPDDLVVGSGGDLWVLNRSGGTVSRVRPDGEVAESIRVGEDPSDIAIGPDAVWVSDRETWTIQRIDPETGSKDEPIRLPGPVSALAVDPDTGQVWAYLH